MPYIYEAAGRYLCVVTFQDRKIPENAGFQFSKTASDERPQWWTARPEVAFRLLEFCEENLREFLKHKFSSWLTLETDTDDIKLTHSPRYTPEDYQVAGAKHILSRKYSYLWYEAGTGKTFTASMAIENMTERMYTNVVICPSFLKHTWREEIDDKSRGFLDVVIVSTARDKLRGADVIIVPDSLFSMPAIYSQLEKLNIGVVVVDEAHRFKNADSRRSRGLTLRGARDGHSALANLAKHVCCMSGTPMPNYRPIELWPIVNAFAPQALGFMNKVEYGLRYCDSVTDQYGTSYGGSKNVPELISKLKKSGYILHQELREGDVPAQAADTIIYLDPKKASKKITEAEESIVKALPLDEILRLARGESTSLDTKVKLKSQSGEDVSPKDFMAELRRLAGEQAAQVCVPILKDVVKTGGEPIVVFAWHKSVISKLKSGLAELNPLVIDGKTPMSERQALVDDFQNNKNQVIILNIVAGGLGFTLTRAHKVFFVEYDWTEGNNDQCVRRLRRKGQTRVVEPHYFVFKNSLAHLMLGVLSKKSKNKTAVNAALTKE